MGTDGPGVTTLVAFMGCPLKCRYCLNDKCHEPLYKNENVDEKEGTSTGTGTSTGAGASTSTGTSAGTGTPLTHAHGLRNGIVLLSPQELYERVKMDNIYFGATGGGICFGGGEPALRWQFIKEFRKVCNENWKITLETCLHYPEEVIRELAEVVDYWIVDVKSLEPDVFESYTGEKMRNICERLCVLRDNVNVEHVTIKVPLIPGFNNEESVQRDMERIAALGFTKIERMKYIQRLKKNE